MRPLRIRRYSYWLVAIQTVALCLGANLVVLAVANGGRPVAIGAHAPFLTASAVAVAASTIAAWQSRAVISTPPHELLRDIGD